MRIKLKTLIFIFLSLLCTFSALAGKNKALKNAAEAVKTEDPSVIRYASATSIFLKSKNAIVIDYETGKILLEKKPYDRITPSSMTKIMTSYLIEEKIIKGEASLDSQFPVSEKAWRIQGSKTFVPLGENMRLEDILRGIIIQSGNDACIVAAEGLYGSEENFADAMNAKAQELGLKDTHFVNSSGWPADNHYSTSYDLALLGSRLIKDHPDYYKIYSEKSFTFGKDQSGRPITQGNRNTLLYHDFGCDGIKSGHTEDGGFGLVFSFIHNQRRFIAVINGLESAKERTTEALKVLNWTKENFITKQFYKAGEVIEAKAPVLSGTKEDVQLIIKEDVNLLITRALQSKIGIDKDIKLPLTAPIKENDIAGKIMINVGEDRYEIPVVVKENIDKINFLKAFWRKIVGWF